MGKKTRSRGRRRPNNSSSGSSSTQQQQQQPRPLVQRLRHADPSTRHATLSALADHPALFFHKNKNNNNHAVLTTVSELVSSAAAQQQNHSHDVLCATAAATCLGNVLEYISQQQQQREDSFDENNLEERTAGWLVILLTRLQQQQQQQQQQHYSLELVQECLRSLVLLLETNPLALERLVRHHANDFLTLATQLLLSHKNTTYKDSQVQPPATAAKPTTIALWVCRGLHSTFDDNPALVVPFLSLHHQPQQTHPAMPLLQALHDTIGTRGHPAPSLPSKFSPQPQETLTVLHAVGAWLAAWGIVHSSGSNNHIHPEVACLLQQHVGTAVAILGETVESLDWNQWVQHYQERLRSAWVDYQAQQADSQLEREILQQQQIKQEPARLIARRLQQQQHHPEDMDTEATTGPKDDPLPAADHHPRRDCAQVWDEVVTEWHQQLQPVRLALEIVTNLLGSSVAVANHDDDNEDATMSDAAPDNNGTSLPEPLVALVLQNQLPDRLLQFLNRLVEDTTSMTTVDEDHGTGGLLSESFADVLSKATAGLGHCLTHWWSSCYWKPEPAFLGMVLRRVASWDTSALVVALQQQQQQQRSAGDDGARALVDPAFVLELLAKHGDHHQETVRDCVCMLGLLLCTRRGPHSSATTVHGQVVQALLHVSTPPLIHHVSDDNNKKTTISQLQQHPSAMVLAEVLNVLMDIYSEDDCHPAIFVQLNVLRHCQQSLPLLKQRIAVEELTKNSGPELLEAWKETAMNAGRFIQYKKGHADS